MHFPLSFGGFKHEETLQERVSGAWVSAAPIPQPAALDRSYCWRWLLACLHPSLQPSHAPPAGPTP